MCAASTHTVTSWPFVTPWAIEYHAGELAQAADVLYLCRQALTAACTLVSWDVGMNPSSSENRPASQSSVGVRGLSFNQNHKHVVGHTSKIFYCDQSPQQLTKWLVCHMITTELLCLPRLFSINVPVPVVWYESDT